MSPPTISPRASTDRSLFDTKEWDIQQRFEAFDREHPEVWRLFVFYAEQIQAAGHGHYSADAILHRVRWHHDTAPAQPREVIAGNGRRALATPLPFVGGFKINDHFTSRYARKLAQAQPGRFGDFFEFRTLHS